MAVGALPRLVPLLLGLGLAGAPAGVRAASCSLGAGGPALLTALCPPTTANPRELISVTLRAARAITVSLAATNATTLAALDSPADPVLLDTSLGLSSAAAGPIVVGPTGWLHLADAEPPPFAWARLAAGPGSITALATAVELRVEAQVAGLLNLTVELAASCPPGYEGAGEARFQDQSLLLDAGSETCRTVGEALCVPCARGYARGAGEALCRPCPAGSFQPLRGQAGCMPCPTASVDGQSNCNDCQQEPFFVDYDEPVALLYIVPNCCGLLAGIVVGVYLWLNRSHPLVLGSSFGFLLVILVGCLIGFSSVFTLFGRPSLLKCTLYLFMAALSFALVMAALLVKMWRLGTIFSKPSLEHKRTVTNARMIGITLAIVLAQFLVMLVASSTRPIGTTLDLIENDIFGPRRLACETGYVLRIITLLFNTAYLVCGFWFMYSTRKLRTDQFGESGFVVVILLVTGVLAPTGALSAIDTTARAQQLIDATFTSFNTFFAYCVIFSPKVYGIYADETFNGNKWRFASQRRSWKPRGGRRKRGAVESRGGFNLHGDSDTTAPRTPTSLVGDIDLSRFSAAIEEPAVMDLHDQFAREESFMQLRQDTQDFVIANNTFIEFLSRTVPPERLALVELAARAVVGEEEAADSFAKALKAGTAPDAGKAAFIVREGALGSSRRRESRSVHGVGAYAPPARRPKLRRAKTEGGGAGGNQESAVRFDFANARADGGEYVVLHPFKTDTLDVQPGDRLARVVRQDKHWFTVTAADGSQGLMPANYVVFRAEAAGADARKHSSRRSFRSVWARKGRSKTFTLPDAAAGPPPRSILKHSASIGSGDSSRARGDAAPRAPRLSRGTSLDTSLPMPVTLSLGPNSNETSAETSPTARRGATSRPAVGRSVSFETPIAAALRRASTVVAAQSRQLPRPQAQPVARAASLDAARGRDPQRRPGRPLRRLSAIEEPQTMAVGAQPGQQQQQQQQGNLRTNHLPPLPGTALAPGAATVTDLIYDSEEV